MHHMLLAIVALFASAASIHGQAPYSADVNHPWNKLHQALFVRQTPDGRVRSHTTDPLLYRGGKFLLEGESHRQAIAALDAFLAAPPERRIDDPVKRLILQHDLWAAFDYVGWYPDDWVFKSKYEPAAKALRVRLAKAIGKLALNDRELAALPDYYAAAVKSKQLAAEHDPAHPERPFLPPDLLDPAGPWVRFHQSSYEPMTPEHFEACGGRSAHIVFMRLPGGRAATESYLKKLKVDAIKQFPVGTMVAMIRRALTVDQATKVRETPITELVQIRVYRRIPANARANLESDFGEQDAYEFVLDRGKLFDGQHGLRAVDARELFEPFDRREGDPFAPGTAKVADADRGTQLKSCIQCHQQPGIHSIASMQRGLKKPYSELFRTYAWNVELNYTQAAKTRRFDWGLLQGLLERKD